MKPPRGVIHLHSSFMRLLLMILGTDPSSMGVGASTATNINYEDCICRQPNVVYLQHARCALWQTDTMCWDTSCDWKCKDRLTNSYHLIENPNHQTLAAAIPVVTHQNRIDCTAGNLCQSLSIAIECDADHEIGTIDCWDEYSCRSTIFSCRCRECAIRCHDWYSCQHSIVQIEDEESGYFIKEIVCSECTSSSLSLFISALKFTFFF